MNKLPARYHRAALAIGTTFFMTFLVSGVATWRALGLGSGMLPTWMTSWMISWAVAAPTMYVVMPLMRRLVGRFIEDGA